MTDQTHDSDLFFIVVSSFINNVIMLRYCTQKPRKTAKMYFMFRCELNSSFLCVHQKLSVSRLRVYSVIDFLNSFAIWTRLSIMFFNPGNIINTKLVIEYKHTIHNTGFLNKERHGVVLRRSR